MVDPGAPSHGRHPNGLGQPFSGRLQFGPSGLRGGDQLAIERTLLGLSGMGFAERRDAWACGRPGPGCGSPEQAESPGKKRVL
jgi:hypothetical protein